MNTINSLINQTKNEINNLTDDEIKKLAYGIKYFDFYAAGITPTEHNLKIMVLLKTRLQEVESKSTPVSTRGFIGEYINFPKDS